jgi:AcrR family transcriptional regulator
MITKEYIIELTTKLFLKHGVKSVTIGEIVKELRTSKRTLYNHFIDKTDLMQACIENYLANIRSYNDEIINNSTNAIEAMGHIHHHILKTEDNASLNFHRDILKYYPSILKDSYEKHREFAFRELLFLAKWGVKEGYFRPELDSVVVMKAVQTLLKLCSNINKFPSSEFSKNRLTASIIIPYLRGLCTEKGIKEVDKQESLYLSMDK